ncbi:DUF742 domain-containing protein [Streptomyces sp. NBC_01136]|uniref:DUF742 domain-containing protein n=1 Tax=unclassified Streptomyces TaxID=2593676 RepID=UPI00324518BA|nr:DUF742 domain-containing protein [Streptomyces sp. NBC_01136]
MSTQSRQPLVIEAAETSAFVRTYTLTGGRTRPRHTLSLETVLEPGPGRPGPGLPEECGQILGLCQQRRLSVAELAGTIGRPVTPVKILISDLLDVRALVVPVTDAYDSSDSPTGQRPTRQLLEALSAGLKARWPDADAYPKAG